VVFDETGSNPFVQARATAVNNGVPGAVFRFASQLAGGPESTFDDPTGFFNITQRVYVSPRLFVSFS
jgi:hypothetical protein